MRILWMFILAVAAAAACGGGAAPASCSPCGDGAIACSGSVQDCVADGPGGCTTEVGATGAATLTLRADGSYSETSADGTQGGTWTEDQVGSGDAVLLHTSAGPTALLSVYPAGACPY